MSHLNAGTVHWLGQESGPEPWLASKAAAHIAACSQVQCYIIGKHMYVQQDSSDAYVELCLKCMPMGKWDCKPIGMLSGCLAGNHASPSQPVWVLWQRK